MRIPFILSATLAVATAPAAIAQDTAGWELRAGLERVAAGVCSTEGACFGVICAAEQGWDPSWFAEVEALGEGPVPDPILAIRTEGLNEARFALTTLSPTASEGTIRRYEADVAGGDTPLLDALQAGETVTVDPGRDFALASFSLRGSRWALTTALELCDSGGPDILNTDPAEE